MLTENSFHVQFTADEITTYYEIVPKKEYFIVAMNGRAMAEISMNGHWKQLNGASLPVELFQSICEQIDSIKSSSGMQDMLPEK
jgi:hypothetical protein